MRMWMLHKKFHRQEAHQSCCTLKRLPWARARAFTLVLSLTHNCTSNHAHAHTLDFQDYNTMMSKCPIVGCFIPNQPISVSVDLKIALTEFSGFKNVKFSAVIFVSLVILFVVWRVFCHWKFNYMQTNFRFHVQVVLSCNLSPTPAYLELFRVRQTTRTGQETNHHPCD